LIDSAQFIFCNVPFLPWWDKCFLFFLVPIFKLTNKQKSCFRALCDNTFPIDNLFSPTFVIFWGLFYNKSRICTLSSTTCTKKPNVIFLKVSCIEISKYSYDNVPTHMFVPEFFTKLIIDAPYFFFFFQFSFLYLDRHVGK
jgi:hypothetical protein